MPDNKTTYDDIFLYRQLKVVQNLMTGYLQNRIAYEILLDEPNKYKNVY
jgi:hypothetical protein